MIYLEIVRAAMAPRAPDAPGLGRPRGQRRVRQLEPHSVDVAGVVALPTWVDTVILHCQWLPLAAIP